MSGGGSPDIIDISRSGRVRKKNSLLAGFESSEVIEKPKPIKKSKPSSNFKRNFLNMDDDAPARVTLKIGGESPVMPKKLKKPTPRKIKYEPIEIDQVDDFLHPDLDLMMNSENEEGELKIDLPLEYDDSEMPILAAQEIIDEGLLDAEDGATEITTLNSISRIKSQAESTYMMEKSRKGPPGNSYHSNSPQAAGTPKVKTKKKKKGPPRATAYLLWSKEYRAQFAIKYPQMDFATVSRKLGEMWATIPANQKKMWKNRASKDSKKGENIKNSTPIPPPPKPKPPSKVKRKSTNAATVGLEFPIPVREGGGGVNNRKSNTKNTDAIDLGFLPATTPKNKNRSSGKSGGSGGSGSTSNSSKGGKKSNRKVSSGNSSSTSRSPHNNFNSITSTNHSNSLYSPKKEEIPGYTPTSTNPVDVAAHFSLLGESLGVIGERLKEHEVRAGPNISGSLSVLLDSLLCATGPLLCLTQQVPELNSIPPEQLSRMMDNIAYLMPGL